ncbi:2217_t:CDS:10 [Entrophospora sp. SA101]|nr:2217_t:CDS:10 [Entrophospora sp. SA101]
MLRSIVTGGFIGWILYSLKFTLKEYSYNDNNEIKLNYKYNLYVNSPTTYYLYTFFLIYFWNKVLNDFKIFTSYFKSNDNNNNGTIVGYIVGYILVLEILVYSYFERSALSGCFILLSSWPLIISSEIKSKNKSLFIMWSISCIISSIFTLLPVEKGENILLVRIIDSDNKFMVQFQNNSISNDDSSDDRIPPSLLNKFGRNKNPLLNNYPYSEGYDPLNPRKHIKRIESAPVIPQISIDEDDAAFEFTNDPIDLALRKFLMECYLPKETQQIDRVMEAFAKRYHENNPELFPSSDTPYILAFSLLMLHTDAFNKSVKRKMTKEDFIKNTRIDGVAPEILEILYDNVTFTQFIYADDDTDVNGQTMIESPPDNRQLRLFSSSKERRKSMRSRNDPYYVIQFKIPTEFKPSIHTLVPVENPYSYMGTLPSMDTTHIHRAFASAHAIRITGVQTRHNGETFNHANTLHQLEEENGTFVLKITKGGKLGRKVDMVDGRKKSGIRNWKQYGVILSGSQLMFFKDEAWPDVILMTAESIAVHDKTYKKYPNVFRLVCPKGHQYLFQAENESEMNDWITKINYAATFKSIGLKMRHSKIDELQGKISTLTSQLQNDVRFRNNLFIMMPYKTSTRDRIIQLALMVAHRIKHTCLELSRLVCYHEILEKDLCATVMEDDYYWLNRKNIPFITEKTKKSATMTLVPMSSTSSLSTMACSSPVTSIADSIQSSPPNSIGNVYLHPSDIELEIVKDDDNNGDNSKYPNNFEEKSSFRDDASSILSMEFEDAKEQIENTILFNSSSLSDEIKQDIGHYVKSLKCK